MHDLSGGYSHGQSSRQIDTVISLSTCDGTDAAGQDYEAAQATVTIPAGETSTSVTLTLVVLDDDAGEDNEALDITGTTPGTIQVRAAQVTIEDDDPEPISISLQATTPPLSEGGGTTTIPVQATLVGGGTRGEDTKVTLSVVDLTATDGYDYTADWDSATLTIPTGKFPANANLTLKMVEDTLYEGDEGFAVRGQNANPGLPVNGIRLAILDNDPEPNTVTLTISDDSLLEGPDTHFSEITATLNGGGRLTSDVNVSIQLEDDGQRSHSYSASPFTPLKNNAGQDQGKADLFLSGTNDDVEDEDDSIEIQGRTDHPAL